jgi:hypothetical protein
VSVSERVGLGDPLAGSVPHPKSRSAISTPHKGDVDSRGGSGFEFDECGRHRHEAAEETALLS